ncbi:conserved hypothetical protein [Histoplasma capsulatum var. duboisii H88]|uniref:Uncharacterized protein n=2 Tax=Ajellomyces capsulatus TaxID=5037 RepID=F0U4I6_AJEC8|nr:conserved hypothetical protein [Histoplasma capsulatum H143]EGC41143.1 conserved hypothetical protein [Histoplasma capsulatum var. duboisii H88]
MSAGEQRIFFIAMTCTTEGLAGIKVNYELLAEKAGLKNASSASVLYGKARRKLMMATQQGGSSSTPNDNEMGPTTPAKANKVTKRTPKSSVRGKDKTTKAALAAATLEADPSPTKSSKIKAKAEHDVDMTGMMGADIGVKNDNGALAPIKSEFANDLATEMIEGTSYPRSELEWSFFEQSLWHVETYKSESEDGPDGF